MPIDVYTLSPESREIYLELGRRVTSQSSLAQANRTLRAFDRWSVEVTDNGYGPDDDAYLSDTHDTLVERYSDRSGAKDVSKLATGNYLTALRNAKDDRQSVRTLLMSCLPPLRDKGQVQDAKRVQTLIEQTSAAPNDTALIDQMKRLHTMLGDPVLVPLIVSRGGTTMVVRIRSSRENLLAAIRERAGSHDVPALADERDILDGIIVTLTRNAARAARVAARRLGQPAIAEDFKLIYFRTSRGGVVEDADPAMPPATPGTDPAPVTE